jgi:hypothetical protein
MRPKLADADRVFWAWLSEVLSDWRGSLVIVEPETVISPHRKGLRWLWTWKVVHRMRGGPRVPEDVRELIRSRSRENPLWGAPRIHGELHKLGIDVRETSVSKYTVRHRRPLSQMWRTLLGRPPSIALKLNSVTMVGFHGGGSRAADGPTGSRHLAALLEFNSRNAAARRHAHGNVPPRAHRWRFPPAVARVSAGTGRGRWGRRWLA